MKVFITGANGFLGSQLARAWTERGHNVRGTCYPPGEREHALVGYRFGDAFHWPLLRDVDTLVHCAHAFGEVEANLSGTRLIYEAGCRAGVRRHIYLSSYSARPDALSDYGSVKHTLERFFLDREQTIVRPGLVIGRGGLFHRNMEAILRYRVAPLLDGGANLLPVIAIRDLVAAMTVILEGELQGAFNLFHHKLVTMRELLETLARQAGRRVLFVNISSRRAETLLRTIEKLRIPFPVGTGTLRALKQNQEPIHTESDLLRLTGAECSLAEMIHAAQFAA